VGGCACVCTYVRVFVCGMAVWGTAAFACVCACVCM